MEEIQEEMKNTENIPIFFIVGRPRSGTTLIDTMLATNPAVISIEESATLEYVIAECSADNRGLLENPF